MLPPVEILAKLRQAMKATGKVSGVKDLGRGYYALRYPDGTMSKAMKQAEIIAALDSLVTGENDEQTRE